MPHHSLLQLQFSWPNTYLVLPKDHGYVQTDLFGQAHLLVKDHLEYQCNVLLILQNSTLRHYTLYEPSHLHDCVKALHDLCVNSQGSSLPAIREKYSQHKVITRLSILASV